MARRLIAAFLFLFAIVHAVFPSKVILDWNTLLLLGGAVVLGFAHRLRGLMPFIDSIELGKTKITLRQDANQLAKAITESEAAETSQSEKKPPQGLSTTTAEEFLELARKERIADTSRESKILQIAAVDKFVAIMQTGVEIEAEILLLAAMMGLRGRTGTFREAVDALDKNGVITTNTAQALLQFWNLRNKIAHAQYPLEKDEPLMKSSLDNGLRLLRLIKNIPRPIYQVQQTNIPLFSDEKCIHKIEDVVGVLLYLFSQ